MVLFVFVFFCLHKFFFPEHEVLLFIHTDGDASAYT